MKPWKRVLAVLAALTAVLVIILAAAPLLFSDEIEARVTSAINARVDATVSFGDVDVGFFRHFPNLSIALDDLTVTGVGPFAGDTLAYVGELGLVVDLGSAIGMLRRGEQLEIRSVRLDRPYLHARVLEDGRASWDILKAVREARGQDAPAERRSVELSLRRLSLEEGRLRYEDAGSGAFADIEGLDHTMSGDFSAESFTLEMTTLAESVTVRHGGVPYLTGAELEADIALDAAVDREAGTSRFGLRENRVAINQLGIALDGAVQTLPDGARVDLSFSGDRAGLREILSLVPAIYRADYEGLEADGFVAVNGFARGRIGGDSIPAFGLNVDVDDGRFSYPDLPLPVTAVFVDLEVSQPAATADSIAVALDRLSFEIGDEPFLASFTLTTPISDPAVTGSVNGRLDLEAVSRAVKLDGIDELRGALVADASVAARASLLEQGAYDRVEASGRVVLDQVAITGGALPQPVAVDTLALELTPRYADLPVFRATVGSSDFAGTARLENLLAYGLREEPLTGAGEVRSRYVALDELKSEEGELEIIPIPENVDLAFTARIDSMTFGDLVMNDAAGALRLADERATLDGFSLATLGGDVVMSGWYETVDPNRPRFEFDFGMAGIDIRGAFETFNTVRALAPAAGYATGEFSADLALGGVLGPDMAPLLPELNGDGGVQTSGVAVQGLPVLDRLARVTGIQRLSDPALSDLAARIEIRNGRLFARPFEVGLGPARATVEGSHGIDGSLDYRMELLVPSSLLGGEASRVVTGLADRANRVGLDLASAEAVRLDAGIGGTMRDPAISLDFGEALASAGQALREQAEERVREEADSLAAEARRRVDAARAEAEARARARADSARAAARADARERADSILAAAQRQADRVREEADSLAAEIREEADVQARRLVDEAANPIARRAAEVAGARLREEADRRATRIEEEADRRAEQLLAGARERADAVVGEAESGADETESPGTPGEEVEPADTAGTGGGAGSGPR